MATVSAGAPALILLAVLKLTIYYSAFNVEITAFLSVGEILTSFLDDIVTWFLLLLTLAFITAQVVWSSSRSVKHENDGVPTQRSTRRDRYIWHLRHHGVLLLAAISMIFTVLVFAFIKRPYFVGVVPAAVLVVTFFAISTYYEIDFRLARTNRRLHPAYARLTIAALIITVAMVGDSLLEIATVRRGKYQNVAFRVGDQWHVSTAGRYYIGNTDRFLFVFDSKTGLAHVYRLADVSEFRIGKPLTH